MTAGPRRGEGAPDGERDAWLREALRHAPDAGLAPPPMLRDAILSQARAAVSAPAAPAAPGRRPAGSSAFFAFWSWLARPPVAASFASVMAATLVGMMWWDRPMDEAMPAPPAPAQAPAAVAVPPPSPAAEKAASPTLPMLTPKPARADLQDAPTAPPPPPPPPPPSRRDRAAAVPGGAKEERSAGVSAARDADAVKTQRAEPAADLARQAPSSLAAPAAPTAGALGAGREREADAFAPAPSRHAEAALSPRQSNAARAAPEPLAPLLAALAADTTGWSRAGADGYAAPVDDALRRWLAELDAASAGRWRAVSATSRAGAVVELQQDGRPAATLSLDARSATLETRIDGARRAWRAELEPAPAERLRRSMPRLPP